MRKSIASRYFASTAILLICSIAVMGSIYMYLSMEYFGEEKVTSMRNTIDTTLRLMETTMAKCDTVEQLMDSNLPKELLIAAEVSESQILIALPDGRPLLISDTLNTNKDISKLIVPKRALDAALQSGIYTENGNLGGFFSIKYYIVAKPVMYNDAPIAFIFAATNGDTLGRFLSDMFSSFILSAGLMLLVSSILSLMITARTTTPLRRIAEAARRFGRGDFTARVPVEGDDEIAQLALTFNNMAASLEKNDMSRRSFMGNIAHELRTPMTSIKGFIDGMLDGTIPPECQQHYLEIVSFESGRLTRLIKNMLDITKLEAGEYKVNASQYDIWETITGVAFGSQPRLEANNIQIQGLNPNKTMVYADSDLVYQVVYNLVDNAIKFCDVGGYIRFTVTQGKNDVTIAVRNSGEGIAADAVTYVFERFYKEDKSRGLNTAGSGLGLHICKVLINLSGGKIWIDSKEGEYCEFLFTLPIEDKK